MPKKEKTKLYWPPSVTVDVVIFTTSDNGLKCLLIKRVSAPFKGKWALPGGFILNNETCHQAALRILKEKAGVKDVYLEQLYTFDETGRDPRGHVLTVAYFALVNEAKIKFSIGKKAQTPTFYRIKNLPPLAFDHKKIIDYAVRRLRYKLEYTNAVFSLLPRRFAFGELQKVYEVILDKKFDKRNFRKKFLALGLIKPLKEKIFSARHRPARLYVFKKQSPQELKRFF